MGNYGSGSLVQQFAVAASGGELNRMRALMDKAEIDVNEALPDGDFALLMAASAGQLPTCQFLLQHKADVNKQADGGYSSLHVAAIQNNVKVLDFLLSMGAEIDQANHDGQTALMLASTHGDIRGVRCLLQAKARVDRQDSNGNEILMLLALKNRTNPVDTKLISLLAMSGADPTVTNDEGFCAGEVFEGDGLKALRAGLTQRIRQREDILDALLEQAFGAEVEEEILDLILTYDQSWPTPVGRRGSEEVRMTQLLSGDESRRLADEKDEFLDNGSTSLAVDGVELDEMPPQKQALKAPLLTNPS